MFIANTVDEQPADDADRGDDAARRPGPARRRRPRTTGTAYWIKVSRA